MPDQQQRTRPPAERVLRVLAAVFGAASCLPMLAMLPAGVATLASTVGIHATSGPAAPLARSLAPVARPLLVLATLSLVGAALRCGIRPAVLAGVGGTLLYLSMYVLPTAAPVGTRMADMGGSLHGLGTVAARAGASGATNAATFYLGLAALVATYLWSGLRHRRRSCHPVSVAAILGATSMTSKLG